MIKAITSKDNPRVKFAYSLKDSKTRKENKMFLGETKKSMDMALEAGVLLEVFALEWLSLPDNIQQNLVSIDVLKKISNNVNPEVVFIAKDIDLKPTKMEKLVYLDHIQDPGNMGTIIRTALAFNYDAVILSKDCVSIYNEKVLNSSKGAIYKMPTFIDELIKYKKSHQIIVSTLGKDSEPFDSISLNRNFIIVLGNEAHGVNDEVLKLADKKVKIPVQNIDSLNVSVAAGILLNTYAKVK
ncbi:MAG: RNA methyltransferase [Bacilli bacterium]|nr:RNA methyltransferase [Bacilli bacterium]